MKKLKSIFWHIFYILLGLCYVIVPDNPVYKIIGACFWLLLLYMHFVFPVTQEHHNEMMKIYERRFKLYENSQNLLLDERNKLDRYYSWNIELQELITEMIQNDASKKEIDLAQSQISQNNIRIKYIQSNISDLEKSTLPSVPAWRFF